MNKLAGIVVGVESEGDISLVEVDVQGTRLFSLVVETPESADYLEPGKTLFVMFKESEVSLAIPPLSAISIRNRLPCRVRRVTAGKLLAHLEIEHKAGPIQALITTRALRDLGLDPGDDVLALVKSTEVVLSGDGR